jgi:hypothetical protein
MRLLLGLKNTRVVDLIGLVRVASACKNAKVMVEDFEV